MKNKAIVFILALTVISLVFMASSGAQVLSKVEVFTGFWEKNGTNIVPKNESWSVIIGPKNKVAASNKLEVHGSIIDFGDTITERIGVGADHLFGLTTGPGADVDISGNNVNSIPGRAGMLLVRGPNNGINAMIADETIIPACPTCIPDRGYIEVFDEVNVGKANMLVGDNTAGIFNTFGPSSFNIRGTFTNNNNPDHGWLAVYDALSNAKAGAYVDDNGQGIIFGDVKSFRTKNPADPSTDIWYASLEGPEVAAYYRGTAQLQNGLAVIEMPKHFADIANPETMTVHLTPLSASSRGLAVVEKNQEKIVVAELFEGQGAYAFDYMILAVRKDMEGFAVVRPSFDKQESKSDLTPQNHAAQGGKNKAAF